MTGSADSAPQQELGRLLASIRTELGLTQSDMALKLGIGLYAPGGRLTSTGRSTVSLLESGKRIPDPALLTAYSELSPPAAERLLSLAAAVVGPPDPEPAPLERPADISAVLDDTRHDRPTDGAPPTPGQPRTGRWRRTASLCCAVAVVAGTVVIWQVRGHEDPAGPSSWTETTGSSARTWSDFRIAGGRAGQPLGPRQSVQVSCRVRGYVVPDGDPWWYRLASPPWNGNYYATSDAFYNDGAVSGDFINGVVVDEQVPEC